jgi:hypothetical protein
MRREFLEKLSLSQYFFARQMRHENRDKREKQQSRRMPHTRI